MHHFHLHLVSDSTGETVSSVARAALVQFEDLEPEEHHWTLIRTSSQIQKVIDQIKEHPGPVMYTIVDPDIKRALKTECLRLNLPCIPVLNTVVSELSAYLGEEIAAKPGKQHRLTEQYFSKVEAINYALAHDDGQAHWELDEADIILVGPSRTSKSPTCVYLAYKGYKAANIPFVLNCPLPEELDRLTKPFIVGLTISADRLQQIRTSRLQSIQQNEQTNYTDTELIEQEIQETRKLFRSKRWPVIDVSKRSVEETAATILQYYAKYQQKRNAGE